MEPEDADAGVIFTFHGSRLIIAFSGTRYGMTGAQKAEVRRALAELKPSVVRHGDCVGSDAEFAKMAREAGVWIEQFPPVDETHRAFTPADVIHPAKTHFARNRDLVDGLTPDDGTANILIATPCQDIEQERGGTWMTVRYARKRGVPVTVVWPDGSVG